MIAMQKSTANVRKGTKLTSLAVSRFADGSPRGVFAGAYLKTGEVDFGIPLSNGRDFFWKRKE